MRTLSKLEKTCLRCNKIYIDNNYNKKRKYCSSSCSSSKPKVKKNCNYCNKEFYLINPSRKNIFCSVSCARKSWKGLSVKPPEEILFKNAIIPEDKTACWLYPKLIMKGYGHLYVNGKKYPAHRFSYEYHNEPINNDLLYVCHRCDVRLCINPSHLFLGTHQDNMRDMLIKGRNRHKLSLDNIKSIKLKLQNRESDSNIAKEFFVKRDTIGRIRRKDTWSHVEI